MSKTQQHACVQDNNKSSQSQTAASNTTSTCTATRTENRTEKTMSTTNTVVPCSETNSTTNPLDSNTDIHWSDNSSVASQRSDIDQDDSDIEVA